MYGISLTERKSFYMSSLLLTKLLVYIHLIYLSFTLTPFFIYQVFKKHPTT